MLHRTRSEVEQLKQASLQTQVIGLQQQLSPHFLFNALSTLKSRAKDDDLKEYVLQLSHIYRYLLDGTRKQVVTLSEEIKFSKAYLYIQQSRFGDALNFSFDIPPRCLNTITPPLSVQLLIENAIKHNAFSRKLPLNIKIYVNDNKELVVSNNRKPIAFQSEGTGIGLQNISDRYKLLFKETISVGSFPNEFIVYLPLIENENYNSRR